MGWSCNADAAKTMDAWTAKCIADTGSQNVFHANGNKYMWETSRREYDDGRICGQVWKFDAQDRITRAGSFRINGDGSVASGPKMLKECYAESESAALHREQESDYNAMIGRSLSRA